MCAKKTQIMLGVNPRKPQPERVERAEKSRQGQDEFGQIVDLQRDSDFETHWPEVLGTLLET